MLSKCKLMLEFHWLQRCFTWSQETKHFRIVFNLGSSTNIELLNKSFFTTFKYIHFSLFEISFKEMDLYPNLSYIRSKDSIIFSKEKVSVILQHQPYINTIIITIITNLLYTCIIHVYKYINQYYTFFYDKNSKHV